MAVYVVTGGANGMGRHFVSALLARGHKVSLADVDVRRAEAFILVLHRKSPELVAHLLFTPCDIRSRAQLADMFARTVSVFGRVDAVLCVAGVNVPDPFLLARLDRPRSPAHAELALDNIDVNLKGTLQTIYAALEVLQQGTILVVSSIAGQYPSSCQATYSASKAGLVAFARALTPILPPAVRILTLVPSSYLPPGVQAPAAGDAFRAATADTLGFVDMNAIWSAFLRLMDRGKSGDVVEVTPLGVRASHLHVPTRIEAMESNLRRRILGDATEGSGENGGAQPRILETAHEIRLDDLTGIPHDVILLNTPQAGLSRAIWESATRRVACDGGADRLGELYREGDAVMHPDVVIGDLDSISSDALQFYRDRQETRVVHDDDCNSTDFTKAVKYLAGGGSGSDEGTDKRRRRIIALGGMSGRVDQLFSSIHTASRATDLVMVDADNVVCVLQPGTYRIVCGAALGPHCGLVPIDGPARIRLRGLEWNLDGEEMSMTGLISTNNRFATQERVLELDCEGMVLLSVEVPSRAS